MTTAARFSLVELPLADGHFDFARDVREGLSARPKRLRFPYFYDQEGSRLFEEICALPEYYLTRTERAILVEHADEIVALAGDGAPFDLVELGSGSARKTRVLIEAALARSPRLRYQPLDISGAILRESAAALQGEYPGLDVAAIVAEYAQGIAHLARDRAPARPRLVLWLGSNVGNFHRDEAAEFLSLVRAGMAAGDHLLLGADLRKDRAALERAYDDPGGVTARFNLNLLARINRELDGGFELGAFSHRASYDEAEGRVQMHLVSRRAQVVPITRLSLRVQFDEGEAIHTEDSYKYSPGELDALAAASGFATVRRFFDGERRFSVTLLRSRAALDPGTDGGTSN